jgi:hypothetical protein
LAGGVAAELDAGFDSDPVQRGSLDASVVITALAATAGETLSDLRSACGNTAATVTVAGTVATFVVFTGTVGTVCSGFAIACLSFAGNASHSATAATPRSAAVPTAAITRCEFERTPCQNEGRMS